MKKKLNSKPIAVRLVFGVGMALAWHGIGFKELAIGNYVWNNFLCCT